MLNKRDLLDDIKTRLGYPIIDLAVTDEMIMKQIDFAIGQIIPYLNNIEVITVPNKITTFEHGRLYTVLRVTSSYNDTNINLDKAINQGFYIINNNRTIVDCALWNLYCDSVQADLNPIGFRLLGDTLYIDGGNPPYTIEAITDTSISTMTDDYTGWVMLYALALTKCIEGEIRAKVKITGMPVETNGSELKSEGIQEKTDLETKLGTSFGLFYATR